MPSRKTPAKADLKAELLQAIESDLATLERAFVATKAGATDEEAKPENDKDTRALEQSYLARGQAARVEELRGAVADVRAMPLRAFGEADPVAIGALVTTSEDEEETLYFVAPAGGGTKLADARVHVVTPKSPLGRALVGARGGDDVELVLGGKSREIHVERVD